MQLRCSAQLSLTLGAFFRQYMTSVRLTSFDSAGTGYLEPFGRATIGFDLWHLFELRIQ